MQFILFLSKTPWEGEQIPSPPHQLPCIYVCYIFCMPTIRNVTTVWNFDVISDKFSVYRINA
jgi:hypothetical protein